MAAELPTRHDLPREGYTVFVREETHAYHPANDKGKPGIRCPGASTIAKAFPDSPDGLMFWVEKMCMEGVSRLSAAQVSVPTDPYALRTILEQHGLRWQQIRDAAATRGTNIHVEVLQALAAGEEIPDLDVLPVEEQGYGQAVFKWWQHRNPKPLNVEQVVLSREHGYAGRFDLRCTIEPTEQDPFSAGTWLWDLKTSKRPYPSDHIQLRLYAIAAKECGIGEVEHLGILQVTAEGEFIEHRCVATERHALLAVEAHKAKKDVDRAMKAAA